MAEFVGEFWIPGPSPAVVSGRLTVQQDKYELVVDRWCITPRQVRMDEPAQSWVAVTGDPSEIAADFVPRILHGTVGDSQLPITLIDAMMSIDPMLRQSFSGYKLLWNAHVDTPEFEIDGVRAVFPIPRLGWNGDPPTRVELGALPGLLYSEMFDRYAGLIVDFDHPVHAKAAESGVVNPVVALLQLWTQRPALMPRVDVQVPGTGWCHLESLAGDAREPVRTTKFFPLESLSLARVGVWLALAARLGPLPYVAISPTNVLQADALLLSTALSVVC